MKPTPLLDAFIRLSALWRTGLSQERTLLRGMRLALALVLTPGRRMISRCITSCGRAQRDWSGDYKFFSRSPWKQETLFSPVLQRCLHHTEPKASFIHVAGDFTHLRKTGKKIPGVNCMRDPMSPPFHVNLIYGLRFLQLAVMLPFLSPARRSRASLLPGCFRGGVDLVQAGQKGH